MNTINDIRYMQTGTERNGQVFHRTQNNDNNPIVELIPALATVRALTESQVEAELISLFVYER